MAIRDNQLVVSEEQAVTVSAESTDAIDLGVVNPNQGSGKPFVEAVVHTAFANGTSIQASLQDSADGVTYADILSGAAVLTAAAVSGKKLLFTPLPPTHRRFLRLYYTVVGTMNAGKINAGIVLR